MNPKARKTKPAPVPAAPIEWPRADPAELARFDPSTKRCTMNCGPSGLDPRSRAERLLLCDDCENVPPIPPPPPVFLSEPFARCVLGMMTACYSEGVGPDGPEYYQLRDWIAATYPHLVVDDEFSWLDWHSQP